MQIKELQKLLYKEIPITQSLAIEVVELVSNRIKVKAPFEANKNIHNTAFAGSIYTTATIAGWSLLSNFLALNNLSGSVVLSDASINYKKPINGDIVALCSFSNNHQLAAFSSQLTKKGRARIELVIDLIEDETAKATMTAKFAVI